MTTPPATSTPPDATPAGATPPALPGAAAAPAPLPGRQPYVIPPIEDAYVLSRAHELTRREHLLVTALLPCALLLFGTNSVMVWLLPEYTFWGLESLTCYGLATFLLGVWFYVKWRYVWSIRKAHHLSFYLKRGIEAIAALALVVMGSYLLGFKFFKTADVTREQRLSLSPRSIEILKTLPEGAKVEIWMPYSESGQFHMSEMDRLELTRQRRAVTGICQKIVSEAPQYTKATVVFTALNTNEEPQKATELASALHSVNDLGAPVLPPSAADNLFVLYTPPPAAAGPAIGPQRGLPDGPRWFFIDKNKMYQASMMTKRGQSQGVVFVGESRIVSTIEKARTNKVKVMYYVDDHTAKGSAVPERTNAASGILSTNNLRGYPLALRRVEKIPEDADFLLMMNIQQPLTPEECEKLYQYLVGGGSMLICADPQSETNAPSGLEPLLDRFGLTVRQDRMIRSTSDGRALHPQTLGIVEDIYLEKELPPNFEWLRQLSALFAERLTPVYLRGACYIEAPRAISDPALKAQHASFYDMLVTDNKQRDVTDENIRGTAAAPGDKDGSAGPFILGGVVQMSLEIPEAQQKVNPFTGRKEIAKTHHLFVMADSDWIFGNDNMGNKSNRDLYESIIQKLAGSELVWETGDASQNYINQNPHSLGVAFFSGILPALILAIVGFLYLSARKQVPVEAGGR